MKTIKLIVFSLLSYGAMAQSKEVGILFGGCQYQGDLEAESFAPRSFKPAAGAIFRYNTVANFFAFKGELMFGQLVGADRNTANKTIRNLSFFSPLVELSAQTEVSITAILNNYWDVVYRRWENRLPINFYLTGGVSVFYFNPKAKYYGKTYTLRDKKTEVGKDYSPIQIGIPVGIGFDMSVGRTRMHRIGVEFVYRKTFTDYLDDVSTGAYPNKAQLIQEGKEIDAALSDRSVEVSGDGNGISDTNPGTRRAGSAKKDSYYTVLFTFTRFINTGTLYR